MTLQRRIDKARNKLAALLSYASCSLGTDLHDSETWPTERDEDEPITTEYDLWYITRKAPKE